MSLNYSVDYEKIFYLYFLQKPALLKKTYSSFFSNKEIDALTELSKKFYENFSETPSKDQVKLLVQKSKYNEKITADIIDIVYDTDISQYEDEWLKRTAEAWMQWRNFDKQLVKTVEYVKLQEVTPENVEKIVSHAVSMISEKGIINFDQNLGLNFFDAEDHTQKNTTNKIKSGRVWIDRLLNGGYDLKTLIVYAGEQNIGKSIFLSNDAVNFSRAGYNTAYVSAEMADYKIMKRLGCNYLNIPIGEYDKKAEDKDFIKRRLDKVVQGNGLGLNTPGKLFVKEFPTSQATVLDIEAYLRDLEETSGVKLQVVVIDYINILSNYRNPNSENTYLKIKQIAEDLRSMAQRNNWLIISATQITRSGYGNTEITMNDIAESAGLGHTVDLMYAIIQDDLMRANLEYWLKILKIRDGEGRGSKCRHTIDYNYMRITETSEILTGQI